MFYTYIVASCRNGTLYTGSTDNLFKRVYEHREGLRDGFTKKYGVHMLVWFEPHETRAPFTTSGASTNGGGRGSSS